jgi:hypothetical protein
VAESLAIHALSSRFLQGRATSEQLAQLTALSGAMLRTLRALGLIGRDAGDGEDGAPRGGLQEYLASRSRPGEPFDPQGWMETHPAAKDAPIGRETTEAGVSSDSSGEEGAER